MPSHAARLLAITALVALTTFSNANKPAWATVSSTGTLCRAPAATNVGNYSNFLIGVSDGTATSSLPVATMTSVVIEALEAGRTWYFTVKAVNTSGIDSDFSNEVGKLL
jgi:hypothetical protein